MNTVTLVFLLEIVFYCHRQMSELPHTDHFLSKLSKHRPKNWQIPNVDTSYAPYKQLQYKAHVFSFGTSYVL